MYDAIFIVWLMSELQSFQQTEKWPSRSGPSLLFIYSVESIGLTFDLATQAFRFIGILEFCTISNFILGNQEMAIERIPLNRIRMLLVSYRCMVVSLDIYRFPPPPALDTDCFLWFIWVGHVMHASFEVKILVDWNNCRLRVDRRKWGGEERLISAGKWASCNHIGVL